jgi:hypothetical protein
MQTTMKKLLQVEDTFHIEGRGVIVMPTVPIDSYSGSRSRTVSLRRPDGTTTAANATFDIPCVLTPPPALYYLCLLVGLTKEDVPVGTEIWIDDDRAA